MIPVEDAPTIAYVDIVHALSEINEYLTTDCEDWDVTALKDDLSEAANDLFNALSTLRPYTWKANNE